MKKKTNKRNTKKKKGIQNPKINNKKTKIKTKNKTATTTKKQKVKQKQR